MGVPLKGSWLRWDQIQPHSKRLNKAAVKELIEAWPKCKDRAGDASRWGDEVEYQIVKFNEGRRKVQLHHEQNKILCIAEKSERDAPEFAWDPEATKYMIESSPKDTYGLKTKELLAVEPSMVERRAELSSLLSSEDTAPFTIPVFPLLGASEHASDNPINPEQDNEGSRFVTDEALSSETRYQCLESNIRTRRGHRGPVSVPVFRDISTPWPWRDPSANPAEGEENHIFVEGFIFGEGACGLQATFATRDLDESRELHDQLCVLGPIMLALTAATPIYKGILSDVDVRWNTTSQALDDRTEEEKEHLPPRWGASPIYIGRRATAEEKSSRSLARNQSVEEQLTSNGFDPVMARFFAHQFARSHYLITENDVGDNSEIEASLLERLQSTIWPHVRLKFPYPDKENTPWMVEFRPMEVQLTDFENAACTIFLALMRRAIAVFELDFCVPIEKIDDNMDRAHVRDACIHQLFWWRLLSSKQLVNGTTDVQIVAEDTPCLVSLDNIINGGSETQQERSVGLADLADLLIAQDEASAEEKANVSRYVDFIRRRARGEAWTGARWMRQFVRRHKEYANDSVVGDSICYDLFKRIKELNEAGAEGLPTLEHSKAAKL